MRIVIIGAGEVGFHLAQRLSEEGQDVVIIEADPERAEQVSAQLDVLTITGNGASLPILEEAGIRGARLLLAVTSKDEVNVLGCLAASRYHVEIKLARVSNPEYYQAGSVLSREHLGIDLMINPERECARETYQLLTSEATTDLAQFADGALQLVGMRVREGADIDGVTLAELDQRLQGRHYVTVGIVRADETLIPTGQSRFLAGDQIFVLAPSAEVPGLAELAGYHDYKLRRVMIAGGSEEGLHLGRLLMENGVACTILDTDRRRCMELAERLPKALVLNADATNLELLEMEGVEGVDGFVALTGSDETNMLISLLAKTSGARKVISLVHRYEYMRLVNRVGIDAAVSSRQSTVNAILRYVRRGNVKSVATLKGIDAEALELQVDADAAIVGTPLAKAPLPAGAVLGAILRAHRIILPRGRDMVLGGDRVIVFALPDAIHEIERLFS